MANDADRGVACRPRSPDRTMPLRFLGPTLARTAGHNISHWALGIHWLLVFGHWSLPSGHEGCFVNGPDRASIVDSSPPSGTLPGILRAPGRCAHTNRPPPG